MKLLHTSDWHLGQNFHGKDRQAEHQLFFEWLIDTIRQEEIDILLVAGDIFDTGSPANYAQRLYYNFITKVAQTNCQHIVIIAGNHDSVATLQAPKEMLKLLNIHIVAGVSDNIGDELLILKNNSGTPEIIICAVPFLRDRDLCRTKPGESEKHIRQTISSEIRNHYQTIFSLAKEVQQNYPALPIIAMGHLFAKGVSPSDSEREIYVGTLGEISGDIFSENCHYTALGHIHRPQIVAKQENIRYSGSPIPLSFSELRTTKQVVIFNTITKIIKICKIPTFRPIFQLKGDFAEITENIKKLPIANDNNLEAWLAIHLTSCELRSNIREKLLEITAEQNIDILIVKTTNFDQRQSLRQKEKEKLSDMKVTELFAKRLEEEELDEELSKELKNLFQEIIIEVEI